MTNTQAVNACRDILCIYKMKNKINYLDLTLWFILALLCWILLCDC